MDVTDISDDEFDLDALMQRIRDDVKKRRASAGAAAAQAGFPSSPDPEAPISQVAVHGELRLRRFDDVSSSFELKDRYRVEDFLRHHDEAFVQNAYRGILRRSPDGSGLSSFLDPLRRGEISKIEILGRIRFSPEGRAARIPVEGLVIRFAMRSGRRIPVVGRVIGILQYVARLPELAENLERLESAYFQRDVQIRRQLDANSSMVEHTLNTLERRTSSQIAKMQDEVARLESKIALVDTALERSLTAIHRVLSSKADVADLRSLAVILERKVDVEQLASIAKRLADLVEAAAERAELAAIEDRLSAKWEQLDFAIDELRDAHESLHQRVRSQGESDLPDSFYNLLEDRFRGTRDDIAKRAETYIPLVIGAKVGTEQYPVLDIGCGRGEWLEVLATHGLVGRGVDANVTMVGACRARGLPATQGDALEFLRSLESSSVGAVTAMHVVEHLPFSKALEIVDESLRVLCPGGVLILETPNPENLLVGANTFYIDPTHRRPIPPDLLHFVAESRGFTHVDILRLHPRPTDDWLVGRVDLERLNCLLFGPQDYAIVARKSDHPRTEATHPQGLSA